jgi:UDP-N-acetylmuramyl tripeptide synthase
MIRHLRYKISIFVVKCVVCLIKALKIGSATNFPGKIARKIAPDILSRLVKQVKGEILAITGTNGKTTTAGLTASIFRADERKIIHNSRGANMLTGITTAAVEASPISGRFSPADRPDNCIFEMDEAYLYSTFDEFNPDIMLVTNLFRDQLDRYGELNTIAGKIGAAIGKTCKVKPLKLVLNADDPMVSDIASDITGDNITRIYYGFDDITYSGNESAGVVEHVPLSGEDYAPQESTNCKCGKPFQYSKIFYGHLGYYECDCGAKRPVPQITATAEVGVSRSKIVIKRQNEEDFEVNVNLPGVYNCYNALAAITIALTSGISVETIKKGFENYDTAFGRAESVKIKGKDVLIQLIKNPIGATEVIKTIKNDENGRLFILINDNYADGRDVSWLWDANFELLSGYNKTAIISGIRASDMAVRLKYAGVDAKNIIVEENIEKAFLSAIDSVGEGEKLYVLPTYTALLELDKLKENLIR